MIYDTRDFFLVPYTTSVGDSHGIDNGDDDMKDSTDLPILSH